MGCRDATPKFDLSQIPAQPVAGGCYPYAVSCPACQMVTGHVCFVGPCVIEWENFTVCTDVKPTTQEIMVKGSVTCSCDDTPEIANIQLVGDHWEYTITCESACGPKTVAGRVNIEPPCVPTAQNFTICSNVTLTEQMIRAEGVPSCDGCDATPAISNINLVGDHLEYTITCTTDLGCTARAIGVVDIEQLCGFVSEPVGFPIPPELCPDILPNEQ
jgi:hypothetical protein